MTELETEFCAVSRLSLGTGRDTRGCVTPGRARGCAWAVRAGCVREMGAASARGRCGGGLCVLRGEAQLMEALSEKKRQKRAFQLWVMERYIYEA